MKENIRCLDPVMKYCQGCKYGIIHYSEDVETYQDTFGASFKTSCIHDQIARKPLISIMGRNGVQF